MNPTCPTGCEAALGAVNFDDCAPQINASEIKRIFVTKATALPFTDWKLAPEWVTRIAQTGDTPEGVIRTLTVIGDKPAGSPVQRDISNGRKYIVGKDHTVNFTVDDVSDENYEFMRALECGGRFRIWYETKGGKLYGGNEGILATLQLDDVLPRGNDEIEVLNGIATWRSRFSPERITSPIFVEE